MPSTLLIARAIGTRDDSFLLKKQQQNTTHFLQDFEDRNSVQLLQGVGTPICTVVTAKTGVKKF